MISELEISGFKGIAVEVKDLKRVNLIGGKNNSGKTSLLEALFLSMDWGNAEMLSRHLTWRGMGAFIGSPESAWYPAFTDFDPKNKIQVNTRDVQGGRRQFSVQVIDSPNAPAQMRKAAELSVAAASTQAVPSPGLPSLRVLCSVSSKPIFDARIYVSTGVPPFLTQTRVNEQKAPSAAYAIARARNTPQEDAASFGKLDEARKTKDLVEALRILDANLEGLSVIPVGNVAHIYADVKGMEKKIPVNLMGDGVARLVSILLQIANVAGGYVLVDEIDNGFHYAVMPDIWKVLYRACKEFRVQMFATTHSYECLAAYATALGEEAPSDYCYVRLDVREKKTQATFYDAQKLRNAIDGGWEVR